MNLTITIKMVVLVFLFCISSQLNAQSSKVSVITADEKKKYRSATTKQIETKQQHKTVSIGHDGKLDPTQKAEKKEKTDVKSESRQGKEANSEKKQKSKAVKLSSQKVKVADLRKQKAKTGNQ